MTDKGLETIGFIGAMWLIAGVIRHNLTPRKKKTEHLCGYHMASTNRRGSLAVLDSTQCEYCKEEETPHV